MKSLLAAAGIALVVLLAACDDEPEREPESEETAIGPGDQYVALGDSYTAAPGTGPVTEQNGCQQTEVNYPHRIAEATGAELADNSCNGANTSNVINPQETAKGLLIRPPQIEGIDGDTDLVTIRLGANDYELIKRIFNCAYFQGASAAGTPCQDVDATAGENALDNRVVDVTDNLGNVVEEIEKRAPDARIILIGYPHLAPAEGTCDELPLPAGDYAYARRIIDGLNDALETVADDHDLTFIDMEGPSEGHDICGDEPWMAGPTLPVEGATPWHPYAAEGEAVADLVLEELQQS